MELFSEKRRIFFFFAFDIYLFIDELQNDTMYQYVHILTSIIAKMHESFDFRLNKLKIPINTNKFKELKNLKIIISK